MKKVRHLVTSDVIYQFTTTWTLVFAKSHRIAPEKLRLAKFEFHHMKNLGISRPLNGSWASPLQWSVKWTATIGVRSMTLGNWMRKPFLIGTSCFTYTIWGLPCKMQLSFRKPTWLKRIRKLPWLLTTFPKSLSSPPSDCTNICAYLSVWEMPHKLFRSQSRICIHGWVLYCTSEQRISSSTLGPCFWTTAKDGVTVDTQKCQVGTDYLYFLRHATDIQGIRPWKLKRRPFWLNKNRR